MMKSDKKVAILSRERQYEGKVEVKYGNLDALNVTNGAGTIENNCFSVSSDSFIRLEMSISDAKLTFGAEAARISVLCPKQSFTFFLRDVNCCTPIYVPEYNVIVTEADDQRSYSEIEKSILEKGLISDFDRFNSEEEETYKVAAARNRQQFCPTWLGVSRDMRFFRVSQKQKFGFWGEIHCCNHTPYVKLEDDINHILQFSIGPGANCEVDITRRLEDGVLPILHSTQREQDVEYHLTMFASQEEPLDCKTVRGSDWQACYGHTGGQMLTEEEKIELKPLFDSETNEREDQLICFIRVEIVNTGRVPRYAWAKAPWHRLSEVYDAENGFSTIKGDRVISINRFEGANMTDMEMAILLQPGESRTLEFLVPHYPVKKKKAVSLLNLDFDAHLNACRKFWKQKLDRGASISVPEKAIDERIKAGLLHCDIATIGLEKEGPLLATIGWYSPIGSESSPIIQFFDCMGWHDVAERSLDFFIARQREDGFIQNFGRYQLETGPWLWTMGEHFRMTRDQKWVERVAPSIRKGCDYLLAWRERNKKEEFRELGYYGLIDGKVADPEDYYHSFMLNALSYVGLQRTAEMLEELEPEFVCELRRELEDYRNDIRTAFYYSLGRAPLMPIGDGSWAPFPPPCAEYYGAGAFYAEKDRYFTHGSFISRDVLLGTTYLVLGEILTPDEIGSTFILKSNQQPITKHNAALSQPYYCRHDLMHALRGEVKPYLKTFYNQMTGLQDCETYTFWEHYYEVSQHKTHEEGWFLMQCRWMLFLEYEDTLRLMSAVPRRWLEHGNDIQLQNVKTRFGTLNVEIYSDIQNGEISAKIRCSDGKNPENVIVRLPHPEKRIAIRVKGGTYHAESESITIDKFTGEATVSVFF